MPSFIRRLVGGAKGRIRRGQRERRTEALYDAALRLLAKHDYEMISVAAIGREARCSVGSFYSRFHDKNAFLLSVISAAFHALTVESADDLAPERWRGVSRNKLIAGLIRHIVAQMSRDQAAAAARTALKLATIKPGVSEPLLNYRAAITSHAIALLAPHPSPRSAVAAVRGAVQLIFAMVIDGTLQNAGPLRLRSPQMIDTLSDLTALYLKLPHKGSTADRDDKAGEAHETGSNGIPVKRKPPDEPRSRGGLLRPDVEKIRRAPEVTRVRGRRPEHQADTPKLPSLINPRNVKPPEPTEADGVGRSRKRRFRLL